ncbi:hypothetical protein AXF42_Ash021648 [Apostasia shenzhenica]|uniref:Uncharacterized protein n=1 Tax=Apostasia shenzhenica TaxID=1088818 RepID=A0A2H9ZRA8_9ASPA|nr:hypothetical protein AXF42_Ash021648 [Apostasia shenzhenica]
MERKVSAMKRVSSTEEMILPEKLCDGEERFGEGTSKLHGEDDLTGEALRRRGDDLRRRWRGKLQRRHQESFEVET